MTEKKYRIKEHLNRFIIEVECRYFKLVRIRVFRSNVYELTTGWKPADSNGKPILDFEEEHGYESSSRYAEIIERPDIYKSLELAKQKIIDWNTKPVYHYLEEINKNRI